MGDPNFVWVVDFGENPTPAMVAMQDPPGGAWEVQIDSFEGTTEGKGSVRFLVSILEKGECEGLGTMITIGTDCTKPFNVKHATSLLDGLHTPDGKFLDRSQIKGRREFQGGSFIGMRAYMWVREYPEGETDERGYQRRPDRNFMGRGEFESQKKIQSLRGRPTPRSAPPRAAPTMPPPGPAPAPPPGPAPGGFAPPPPAAAGANASMPATREIRDLFGPGSTQ